MCISELPADWDLLYLGGQEIKTVYYSSFLKEIKAGTGGYAILFRNTVYDRMIEGLTKEDTLADHVYAKELPKIKAFKTFVNLVYHNDGISTIKNKFVSYPKLNGSTNR